MADVLIGSLCGVLCTYVGWSTLRTARDEVPGSLPDGRELRRFLLVCLCNFGRRRHGRRVTIFDPNALSGVDAAITLVLHVEMTSRRGATLEELTVLADKDAVAPLVLGALGIGPHASVLGAALRVGVEQGYLVENGGVFSSTTSASDSLHSNALAAELLRALR